MTHHPYKIVVAVDLSEFSERVFMSALHVAKERRPAEVHMLVVAELGDSPFAPSIRTGEVRPEAVQELRAYAQEKLERFEAQHGKIEGTGITAHVLLGAPAEAIAWFAARLDADLIVLGTHGRRGLRRFFMGSVAERVTRLATCAVLIEREKAHDPNVVIPEIEPPVDEKHPAHYLRNHHYTPIFHSPSSPPSWGGFGG